MELTESSGSRVTLQVIQVGKNWDKQKTRPNEDNCYYDHNSTSFVLYFSFSDSICIKN